MRNCSKCKESPVLPDCATGKKRYYCRECTNKMAVDGYHRNRDKQLAKTRGRHKKALEFVNELKNKPCMDCGIEFPPCCMDFDHRDSNTKLAGVAQLRSRTKETILVEVAKCDLVCANCHRIRTHLRYHHKAS